MSEKSPDGIDLTPFNDDFRSDPYAVYRRLRESDPVHRDVQSFYGKSWTISAFHHVNALLRDPRLSVDPRKIGMARDPRAENIVTARAPDMMNLDDPDHARLRALVQKAFTPSSVQDFCPTIERIVDDLLTAIGNVETFDAIATLAKPLPTIAIADMIGVDSRDHADFKRWTDSLLLQGLMQPTPAQWQEIVDADNAMRTYMLSVVAERRARPRDDLISRLIAARDEDARLSDEEVVGMCTLLIGAGNFTTTDLIGNALLALLEHPEQRANLQTAIEPLIEEVLRYDPPSLFVRRYAIEDIEIDGNSIEKGSVVTLIIAAANHDPARFANPDQFNASQSQPTHIAFGRGIHHCLGAPLARLETQVAVASFFARFPSAKLVSVKRNRTMGFRGCRELVIHT